MIPATAAAAKNINTATIRIRKSYIMKLFLIRHAEGDNFKTNWQFPNTPLSSHGVRQANALAAIKRFSAVNNIFSSNLARAKQTANIIAKDIGQVVEERVDIKERVQSSRIYGLIRTDLLSETCLQALQENTNDWDYKWDGEEESKNEVRSRAISFKNYLEQSLDGSILVVSHENFLKQLIPVCILGSGDLTKDSEKLYRSINIECTGVSLLIFNPTSKQWKIWYINDYSHLDGVKP